MQKKTRLIALSGLFLVLSFVYFQTAWGDRCLLYMELNGWGDYDKRPEGWTWLHESAHTGDLDTLKEYFGEELDINAVEKDQGLTPLHIAVEYGHANITKFLLEHGANPDYPAAKKNVLLTPLHIATNRKHAYITKLLLEHGAKINSLNSYGGTPLYVSNSYETSKLLIEHGAEPNHKSQPLLRAVNLGKLQIAQLLIEHGADINAPSGKHQRTPIEEAIYMENPSMVRLLIKNGADLRNPAFKMPLLHQVARRYRDPIINRLVIESGIPIETFYPEGVVPLNMAEVVQASIPIDDRDSEGRTPLHIAAAHVNMDMLAWLISQGANIEARDKLGETPLHKTTQIPSHDAIGGLLSLGADLEAKNSNGATVLHKMAESGKHKMAKYLLTRGANEKAKNNQGQTPIDLAFAGKHKDTIDVLLEAEKLRKFTSPPTIHGVHGGFIRNTTWLDIAVMNNDLHMAKRHLALGESVNQVIPDQGEATPLHKAVAQQNPKMVKLLLDHGAKVDAVNSGGETPLFNARSKDVAALLLKNGANPNYQSSRGTVLMRAIDRDYFEIAKILIRNGADVNASMPGFQDTSPIQLAVHRGNIGVVQWLVDKGAHIKTKKGSRSLLHTAAQHNRLDVAQFLSRKGLNIKAADKNKTTPLHLAAQYHSLETVQWLISKGADIHARDGKGKTPLHMAMLYVPPKQTSKSIQTVKLLQGKGADLEAADNNGYTPLLEAANSGNPKVMQYLLDQGADIHVKNKKDETALDRAKSRGHAKTTKILEQHLSQ